jgi:trigger factor
MSDTYNVTVTKEENSSVKIEGEIAFSELEKQRDAAVKHLGKDVKIDGFRPGHIPADVLEKHIGEMVILGEMAERALAAVYPEILNENKLDVIGHPQVSLTKLAPDNPLGFTAVVAVMPEVTIPDYKKVAAEQKKESDEVTDKDLEDAITDLQRKKMAYERMQANAQKQKEAEKKKVDGEAVTELPTPETVEEPVTTEEEFNKLPLPELTDEYVQGLGEFKTVDEFKTKMREHLQIEKAQEVAQKHRAAITDAIIDGSSMELPQVMIDSEINQMFGQMEQDLERANLKMEDYLSHIKKTREDLIEEWKPAAEKRAKLQLVLNEIAKNENVELDQGKVDQEVDHLITHYKDADPARVRIYVESIMKNEEIMKMLEGESK